MLISPLSSEASDLYRPVGLPPHLVEEDGVLGDRHGELGRLQVLLVPGEDKIQSYNHVHM